VRLPPAPYLQNTGDPGVYMSMAGYFAQKGTLDVKDDIRDRLVSPEAIARFDANNAYYVYQPGISVDQDSPGHYIFQFYHVHPAWMAIFGGLFGLQYAAWSQILFGLLSIFFAALIVERLTDNWKAGVAVAGLFALLPLHVYFSKLPISEIPTLALAFIAMYAMVRGATPGKDFPQVRWLLLAALAFAALFLTRISGFVYLPVIYFGAVICQVFIDDRRVRRLWGIFWFSLAALYFGSVVYGLVWSGPYSISLYHMHFGLHMLRWLPQTLLALVVVSAIPFVFLSKNTIRVRVRALLLRILPFAQRWLPLLLLALVLAGAARAGILAFTDHYKGNTWYDEIWGMSHGGYQAILRSALLIAAEHLGPALVILLPLALWKPRSSAPSVLLTVMVIVMIGYTAVLQWFLPYQYYYARYLLSEVVPFSMLLIALRAADWWQRPALRPWIVGAMAFTGAYFAWFSWPLIGLREASGADTSLARIADQLDRRSALLIDEASIQDPARFITPLRMWFGKSLYSIHDMSQLPAIVLDLKRAGIDDLHFLGPDRNVPAPFVFEMKTRFEQTAMKRSPLIPRDTDTTTQDFVLSRLDDERFTALALTSSDGLEMSDIAPACCTGFFPRDVWTEERALIRRLALPKGTWRRLTVTMHGYRPDYAQSGLVLRVNSKELSDRKLDGRTFEFSLGELEGPISFDLEVDAQTFVPRELGLNDDPRHLGVDIATLRVE